jgi:ATP/ADP translocase
LRVFEYGFNKPSREIIYSQLKKADRYKSTVFIDTFVTRFGDLSGSIFMGIGKMASIGVSFMPSHSNSICCLIFLNRIQNFEEL